MKFYTLVDYATQGYMALVGLCVVLLRGPSVPSWPILLLAHAVGMALVHVLILSAAARPRHRVLDFVRHFYPVLLYTGFYRETGVLNRMLDVPFLDPFFIRLEGRLFGGQPSLDFMEKLPYPFVSEFFYAAYFSYYLMIAGVGVALFARNREQFFHFVSVVSFVFYVCYFIYLFTPVMGPRIFYREFSEHRLPADVQPAVVPPFPAAVQAGPLFQIMAGIYRVFEAPGAAFPSSHVAVALGTLYFSFLYLRPVRWLHLMAVILLCLATVYCRYHYVVDVIAGALVAAILIPLCNWLYLNFRQRQGNAE